MAAEDTGRHPDMDATVDSQLLAGATAGAPLAASTAAPEKGVWSDLEKQGSGLKQKLRDMKRQVDTEVLSARRDLTMKKSATKEKEADITGVLEEAQKDIMGMIDESFGIMSKFYPKQKNEDMRLQSQIMQLNQENVGMAQSLLALDRRLKHIEEDLHGVATQLQATR
jgi:hypothetical protein